TPGPRGFGAIRLAFVPGDPLDEGMLLIGVRLPQEAAHLVVADADPPEQVLHAAGRIADGEGVKKPLADLIGVAEGARGDLLFELVYLPGGELARVALVVQGTQSVDPLVAIDPEPFAQLAQADPQQVNDFLPAFALGNGQDRGEALVDTPVEGSLAAAFDLTPLLGRQDNRFRGRRCVPGDGSLL